MDTTLLLASNNPHKLRELTDTLGPLGVQVTTLPDPPEVEETGTTYRANALLKARAFADLAEMPALADDSGLSVDALDGAPGVYSAHYAGTLHDTPANKAKLLHELSDVPLDQRRAAFHCVLALVSPPGPFADALTHATLTPHVSRIPELPEGYAGVFVRGITHGTILTAERGDGGFGYDPLFFSDDLERTFAEVPDVLKSSVSHRGRAVRALHTFLDDLLRA